MIILKILGIFQNTSKISMARDDVRLEREATNKAKQNE
jgi:hypothetical protein